METTKDTKCLEYSYAIRRDLPKINLMDTTGDGYTQLFDDDGRTYAVSVKVLPKGDSNVNND